VKHLLYLAAALALLASCASAPKTGGAPAEPVASAPAAEKSAAPTPAPAPVAEKPAAPAAEPPAPVKKEPIVVVVKIPVEKKSSLRFGDGSLDEYALSEWDETQTKLLAQSRFTASGTLVEKITYSFAADAVSVKLATDGEGKVVSRRDFAYDSLRRLAKDTLSDAAGKVVSSSEYAYNASGARVSWAMRDAKNVVIAETVYAYKDGRLDKSELRDGTGKKTGSSVYEYAPSGSLIRVRTFNAGDSLVRIELSQWEGDRLIREERTSAGGQVQQRISYEYGAQGEMVRKTIEDILGKSKQIIEYEYSFREERRTVEK